MVQQRSPVDGLTKAADRDVRNRAKPGAVGGAGASKNAKLAAPATRQAVGIQQAILAAFVAGITLLVAMTLVAIITASGTRRSTDPFAPRIAEFSPAPTPSATRRGSDAREVRDITIDGPNADELLASLRPLHEELAAIGTRTDAAAERKAALLRLRLFRRLCRVADRDVVLDTSLDDEALAAADVCRRLSLLTHEPSNPGLPIADFEKAYRGARSGNLASGIESLVRAVEGWMDDSDAANVATLGHRRWCLNPALRRVGFGRVDSWCAMWAHDCSGSGFAGGPAICFPPAGAVPIDMFRPHYAWSVTLDPGTFRRPRPEKAAVSLYERRSDASTDALLNLELLFVETSGYGIDNCIIFRPQGLSTAVGRRYRVLIEGIEDRTGAPVRIEYTTEFVNRLGD